MKGGESPVIAPGFPEKSKLFQLLTTNDADDRMPQKGDALSAGEIDAIRTWIANGALFDGPDQHAPLASLIVRTEPEPPERYPAPWPLLALAFSPDGTELAVGGYHEVTIWNSADGKLLRRIKRLPERIHALAYSIDGKQLLVAGGAPGLSGAAVLCDPQQARIVRFLGRSSDTFLAAVIRPDGKWAAVGGADNIIHIFNLAAEREEKSIQQHADWVVDLAFSSDGSLLASASRDRTARLFKFPSGELETSYNEQEAPVTAIAFSADDKKLFSAGRDGKIHAWSASDAKKKNELANGNREVLRLVSAGEVLFSAGAEGLLRSHQVSDLTLVRAFSGANDWIFGLTVDRPSHRVAAGGKDGQVRIWNSETGALLLSFSASPGFPATARTAQVSGGNDPVH